MPDTSATRSPDRWTTLREFGFRLAFCYLLLYALSSSNANLLYVVPKLGAILASWLSRASYGPAVWLAQHTFHITGAGANLHPTGSGDTAIDWIATAVMLVYALAAAVIWLLLCRRHEYRNTAAWLRFVIRLTLVLAMANYGFSKLFPMQMAPPSLAVLNEPVGSTSPMTLLWTLIGFNPAYEMVCGGIEVAAAALLFFRRTALVGALLTLGVMGNVLLYNLFFDVPVKLYSAHLVLFAIAIIAPDASALWTFFWQHKLATPTAPLVPAAERRGLRIATNVLQILLALMILTSISGHYQSFALTQKQLRNPGPFTGQWHLDRSNNGGQEEQGKIVTGDGSLVTDLYLEPNGRVTLRDASGVLWRAGKAIDEKDRTFALYREGQEPLTFNYSQPDPSHLVLTPAGDNSTKEEIYLTSVPLSDRYLLLNRGFRMVNEWPFEH